MVAALDFFDYDASGNRVGGYYQTGTDNRLTSDGYYRYLYDNEGNRTKRTTLADGSWIDYTWDYHNRVTQETFKNSGGAVTKIVSYTYDSQGRQIRRGYDDDGTAGPHTMSYLYDVYQGVNLYLETDSLTAATPKHRYLYGQAADEIFATDGCTNSLSGVYWGLTDHEGTPRDVIDSTATPANHHLRFDSFGKPTDGTAPVADYLFGLSGMAYDSVTNEYKTLNRKYDPQAQRFTSQDPSGLTPDSNPYRYCGNDPLVLTDPSGLCSQSYVGNFFSSVGSADRLTCWKYFHIGIRFQ